MGARRFFLSEGQLADIRARLVAGETARSIAESHGVAPSTIDHHRRRLGIVAPREAERAARAVATRNARRAEREAELARGAPVSAGGRVPVGATAFDEARRLHAMGRRHTEIAALLRIPHRAVAEAIKSCQSAPLPA